MTMSLRMARRCYADSSPKIARRNRCLRDGARDRFLWSGPWQIKSHAHGDYWITADADPSAVGRLPALPFGANAVAVFRMGTRGERKTDGTRESFDYTVGPRVWGPRG